MINKMILKNNTEERQICLIATHVNFGMINRAKDWRKTQYILFEDGTLYSIFFKGFNIYMTERKLSAKDLNFIKSNIEDFIKNAPKINVYDGSAWSFECSVLLFELGYIYNTELEKIADILIKEE